MRAMERQAMSDVEGRLADFSDGLSPQVNRRRVVAELDRLFLTGLPPDPLPDGFLRGRLLGTTTWAPFDALARGLAGMWMPWQGKVFDPAAMTGINRFSLDVRLPMMALWPSYVPVLGDARLEAFVFRNRIEPGALDPGLRVLKIDYDFDANPGFLIRRILDELVQLADGVYLGKVLMRYRGTFRRIGFFSLAA